MAFTSYPWSAARRAVLLAAGLCCSLPGALHAEEGKSALSANKLKLPKGPGSIEGLGENAELNLGMGLATYGIPIVLPPGHGGFGPSLRLAYGSGSGNSVVGIGWSVPVPHIERMTAKGLPRYGTSDLFAADGSEELVRLPGTSTYRARYESGFVRYTWVDYSGEGKGGYWLAEYPDGRKGYFGADAQGVHVPAARVEQGGATFSYYLVEMLDVLGHSVRYSYTRDGAQPYLTRIEWVDTPSGPRYAVRLTYEVREDALSDGKPGFEVVLGKRLTSVEVLVRGQLLRRYRLAYEAYEESGGLSRLARVSTYGSDDASVYPAELSFRYSGSFDPACSSQALCNLPYVVELPSVGVDFKTGRADLIDINGDGLVDVVDTTDGEHSFHYGALASDGAHAFAMAVDSSVARNGAMQLSSTQVQMVDLDGDGFGDMIDGLNHRVLWNRGVGDWVAGNIADTGLPDFAADANLRFFDYDNDRAIDCMHSDGSSTWYFRNRGDGTFEAAATDGEALGWSFAGGMRLADMNGDGLQDAVLPLLGAASYRMSLGRGRFAPAAEMFGLPADLAPSSMELVDINGDGLADVVVVLGNEVQYALNENGKVFADLVSITQADGGSIPERAPETSVRFADMNGSGSTDVVWITPSGHVTYLELFPKRPNLVTRIDNGLGKVIEIHYGSSVEHMARDGGAGAWTHRLPHPTLTVDRIDIYDTLSGVHQSRELHYSHGYYDGVEKQFRGFARVEVRALGDASMAEGRTVSELDVGELDPYRKGLLVREVVESGGVVLSETTNTYADCPLSGVPATTTPVRHVCQTRSVQMVEEGAPASEWVELTTVFGWDGYGNRTREEKHGVTSVGGGACEPCERDPTRVQGRPCGAQCLGDESVVSTDFIAPQAGGAWLLRLPFRKRVHGAAAGEGSEELIYYDGAPYVGLSLGAASQGLVSRVTQKVDEAGAVIDAQRFAYDADGNVVSVKDPKGRVRLVEYDADRLLPRSEEIVFDDPSHLPYRLRQELLYDPLYEQPLEASSWMRVEGDEVLSSRRASFFAYDVFGRLRAIAKPGDTLDAPTQELSYELANPVSAIRARTRSVAGGPLDLESVQCFDGLGRKVQERTKVEGGRYQVSGYTVYNVRGEPARVYQPYEGGSAACDTAGPAQVSFVTTRFDATGRPLEIAHPDGGTYGTPSRERLAYGPLYEIASDSEDLDPESPHHATPTTTRHDGLGRPVAIERLLASSDAPVIASYSYDPLGRLTGVRDAAGHERTYQYDLIGRLMQVRDPDAGVLTHTYDAAGNRVRTVDGRGVAVASTYDEAGRLTSVYDESDPVHTRSYLFYDQAPPGCAASECTHPEGELAGTSYPLLDGAHFLTMRGLRWHGYDHILRHIGGAHGHNRARHCHPAARPRRGHRPLRAEPQPLHHGGRQA